MTVSLSSVRPDVLPRSSRRVTEVSSSTSRLIRQLSDVLELQHQAFEDVALDVRAREAVEEEPVRLRVLRDRLLDQLHDDLVGDEAAGGDDALRLQAQLRLRRQLLAQQVAGGDVEEVELLDEGLRLRPLAGPGRAEQRDIQHAGRSPLGRGARLRYGRRRARPQDTRPPPPGP